VEKDDVGFVDGRPLPRSVPRVPVLLPRSMGQQVAQVDHVGPACMRNLFIYLFDSITLII
jgi:hypothetical protein